MSYYVTAFTAQGIDLAERILDILPAQLSLPQRLAESREYLGYASLQPWVEEHFATGNTLIFVGACGIAVRAIAPFVKDKYSDAGVLVVDQLGQVVIPLLSGHVGGANQVATTLAQGLGAIAAIGTATDLQGVLAIDLWAKEKGLALSDRVLAKEVSAQMLEGGTVWLQSDFPITSPLPTGMSLDKGTVVAKITVSSQEEGVLRLIPKILHLGIGCRRGKSQQDIATAVERVFRDHALEQGAIATVGSIDLKADEAGLIEFCQGRQLPFHCHSPQDLAKQQGDFTPSAFVAETTGVDNVCERGAVAEGGRLLVAKQAWNGVTVAVSQEDFVI